MYHLYVKFGEKWQRYASFQGRFGDYREQVREAIARKRQDSKEELQNAAAVMEGFALGREYYESSFGKLVMRALRRFDEVGLSNEVYESLEEALEGGADAFALLKDGEEIADRTLGEFSVRI